VHKVKIFYLEQLRLNGIKSLTKGLESENAEIVGENNVDCFFDARICVEKPDCKRNVL
jgi:hypothetical protein